MSQVPLIGGDVSPSDHINQTNTAIRELNSRDITELFKDETGVRRVLLGKGADGFYGLKVSKPTFDVYTASGDELAFTSDQNVPKILDTGTATVTLDPGYGSYTEYQTTIVHDFGNTPMVLGSVDFPPASLEGRFMLPCVLVESSGGTTGVSAFIRLFADSFVLCVKARNSGSDVFAGTYTFRYYILQETAN